VRPLPLLLLLAVLLTGCTPPITIAVVGIIDPDAELSNNPRVPWQWALENIEAAGGVAGREIVLQEVEIPNDVVPDAAGLDRVIQAGNVLAEHPEIVAVLGFNYSWRLDAVAPLFIAEQKVVISPTSTAGSIYRKHKGNHVVWRVTESDVAQTQMMLVAGLQKERKKPLETVALLTSYDGYGTTFFDTFAFFAAELGLTVTDVRRYDQDDVSPDRCLEPLAGMLDGGAAPELLYLAASNGVHVDCVVTELDRRAQQGLPGGETDLFLTDTTAPGLLADRLGSLADGLEGTQLSFDQSSGFAEAFAARTDARFFGEMANYYDALMLLAYGLEHAHRAGANTRETLKEGLAQGLKDAVNGRGTATHWDTEGVAEAMARIRAGEDPDLSGATGPLLYDPTDDAYTDLLFSTYWHWRHEDGAPTTAGYFPTYDPNQTGEYKDSSLFEATAERQAELDDGGQWAPPADHGATRALILAGSSGPENHRHQSDALALYDLLRDNGMDADDITLVLAGDLGGPIHNRPGGPDLREHLDAVDVGLDDIDAPGVLTLLDGLGTGPGDNLLVFLVGHGGRDGFHLGGTRPADNAGESDAGGLLTGANLRDAARALRDDGRMRRMLIVVESCFGGGLGVPFTEDPVDGVLLLSGASPFENSLAANYDPDAQLWLADEFAFRLHEELSAPDVATLTLDTLYVDRLYPQVRGSHVSIYGASTFGSLGDVGVTEFIAPPP